MGRLRWACGCLAVAMLAVPRSAYASAVDATGQEQNIGEALELLRDPSGAMTAEEASNEHFEPSTSLHPNFGFADATVWARVTLRSRDPRPADLVLDVAREWVNEVDLWRISAGHPEHIASTGAKVPVRQRAIPVERAVVPISLDREETYLIRVRTQGPLDLLATLAPRRDYLTEHVTMMLFFGGYYAVLLGIAAYSLILFANLRDRLQAGVAILLTSYALVEMCAHGHLSRLLPGGAGWFELDGLGLAFAVFSPTITFLAREVSHAKGKWLSTAGWSGAALCVASVSFKFAILTLLGVLLAVGATLVACVIALRSRATHATQFTIAVGAFAVSMLVTFLTLVGWLPARPANEYGNHVGATVMSVLLSLIVADSIRVARAELGRRASEVAGLNEELRFQVAARSRELVDILARQQAAFSTEAIKQGDVFEGRYRVEAFLGNGGMGSVYEVQRTSDARRCALKVVTSARSGAEAARIAREAEIGAHVRHPNLLQILDVGVARHGPYLVMELVPGGSLDAHQERWEDVRWVLRILRGTAAGLAELHAAKIVHRDLKPANVLLDGDVPKLADFGIARLSDLAGSDVDVLDATVDAAAIARVPRLTEAHALMGTPLYMAPESALGAAATSYPVDVFAFGVMAIEMLSKRHPFDELPVLAALAGKPHPAHRSVTNVDEELARSLDACLDADAKNRPTMADMLRLLMTAQGRAS